MFGGDYSSFSGMGGGAYGGYGAGAQHPGSAQQGGYPNVFGSSAASYGSYPGMGSGMIPTQSRGGGYRNEQDASAYASMYGQQAASSYPAFFGHQQPAYDMHAGGPHVQNMALPYGTMAPGGLPNGFSRYSTMGGGGNSFGPFSGAYSGYQAETPEPAEQHDEESYGAPSYNTEGMSRTMQFALGLR